MCCVSTRHSTSTSNGLAVQKLHSPAYVIRAKLSTKLNSRLPNTKYKQLIVYNNNNNNNNNDDFYDAITRTNRFKGAVSLVILAVINCASYGTLSASCLC